MACSASWCWLASNRMQDAVQKQHMLTAFHVPMLGMFSHATRKHATSLSPTCTDNVAAGSQSLPALLPCRAEMACCSKGEARSHKGLDKMTEEIVSTGKCSYTQVRAVLPASRHPRAQAKHLGLISPQNRHRALAVNAALNSS